MTEFLFCPVHQLASRVLGYIGEGDTQQVRLECGDNPPIATLESPIFEAPDLPAEAQAPVAPEPAAAAAEEAPPAA